jgi:UDP-glucuronate 4-epimerase
MTTLVTGAAGFIGMHLALRLARDGADVVGVDNFDPYYDVALKRARADQLARAGVRCVELDLADHAATAALFRDGGYARVAHLAAQPGVRYSLQNPAAYIRNNIDAFASVIEACRHTGVEHLVYASSSSVYGANHTLPYSEDQNVDHPVSLYAATKKADELIAHSYSHLYRLPTTGLRFFTVYGPWGRPDMAAALFTRAIIDGTPIKVFNFGRMRRDFTYIDDIVEGVMRVLSHAHEALSSE